MLTTKLEKLNLNHRNKGYLDATKFSRKFSTECTFYGSHICDTKEKIVKHRSATGLNLGLNNVSTVNIMDLSISNLQ